MEEEESIPQRSKTTQILEAATMSSGGGFRKGEIDGKLFFIFTFLPQPDNPSSSSSETTTVFGGTNDLLQPQFICPTLRRKVENIKWKENSILCTSPHFPTTRSGDQLVQDLLDSDDYGSDSDSDSESESERDSESESDSDDGIDKICKLPISPLFWCNNHESASSEFKCNVCKSSNRDTQLYLCVTCGKKFHKECVESPSQIKHPSYPFFSFRLSYYGGRGLECGTCTKYISGICYFCPTSRFGLHPVCAMKPIPFVIDHSKRHPHPLTFFPKQAYLPCNVCGLIIESIPTYLCVPCVFIVHQDCVYFPIVIKISRHQHRISFAPSIPSGEWSCGVCRKEVDNRYGAYSCNKCDGYFVHTRCALREDLWNGEELEGIPEEPEITVEPFEMIAEGIILHFSHGHHLKLEVSRVYDNKKFCQACVLPIYEGNYYSCMDQCDFILHEACVNASRKKHHPLHAHPLTLKVVTNGYDNRGCFKCDACLRRSCSFVYESDQGGQNFRLDLRCALVSEPFEYQGHEHPLYLALTPKEERSARCQICRDSYTDLRKLNCIKCDYVICFTCATLPYNVRYKHDKHLLTFQKEKEALLFQKEKEASDESGWCELCEKKLEYSRKGGFYACDECCTTVHVNCLLGKNPYMRPGQSIMNFSWEGVHIVRNNTMSRPFCQRKDCREDRCPYGVIFKWRNKTFCSFGCTYNHVSKTLRVLW